MIDPEICKELWQDVRLTDEDIEALTEAADRGDDDAVQSVVDGAYERLFVEG